MHGKVFREGKDIFLGYFSNCMVLFKTCACYAREQDTTVRCALEAYNYVAFVAIETAENDKKRFFSGRTGGFPDVYSKSKRKGQGQLPTSFRILLFVVRNRFSSAFFECYNSNALLCRWKRFSIAMSRGISIYDAS